ncbi:MAG: aminotransferase class V-fold PLP-dependent enzyme [Pseudomonadota bacterium]
MPTNHLDVEFVRSCFPTFAEPLAAKTAFFENAGGSYVAGGVLERLMHFYRVNKVQPYGQSEILRVAGEQMDAGRQTMADLLGVPSDTVTLGASTTQNFNTLAHACAPLLGNGREVIVTGQDHEANIGAWERLCQRTGAKLVTWSINPDTCELELDAFKALLNSNTAIVCMTHSSNIVGTLNPVSEVIELARANGTRVVVDGVSYAPHQWPDIPTLQPDAYGFSTYKTYATHLGVMYVADDFLQQLDPQCHYFNRGYAQKTLDSSGPDHAAIAALDGLGNYFTDSFQHHFGNAGASLYDQAQQVSSLMHAHETALCDQLLDGINALPIRILGKTGSDGREANVALVSQKHSSEQLSKALAEKDIAAGNGHFYALRLLESAGITDTEDGVLRISMSHYNTSDDVQRVVDVLRAIH